MSSKKTSAPKVTAARAEAFLRKFGYPVTKETVDELVGAKNEDERIACLYRLKEEKKRGVPDGFDVVWESPSIKTWLLLKKGALFLKWYHEPPRPISLADAITEYIICDDRDPDCVQTGPAWYKWFGIILKNLAPRRAS